MTLRSCSTYIPLGIGDGLDGEVSVGHGHHRPGDGAAHLIPHRPGHLMHQANQPRQDTEKG